jgi:hypothetical protein
MELHHLDFGASSGPSYPPWEARNPVPRDRNLTHSGILPMTYLNRGGGWKEDLMPNGLRENKIKMNRRERSGTSGENKDTGR